MKKKEHSNHNIAKMNDRSYIENAGIHNSVEFYPQVTLKQSISYQHPVTTSHITKISKSRRYHSFQVEV